MVVDAVKVVAVVWFWFELLPFKGRNQGASERTFTGESSLRDTLVLRKVRVFPCWGCLPEKSLRSVRIYYGRRELRGLHSIAIVKN